MENRTMGMGTGETETRTAEPAEEPAADAATETEERGDGQALSTEDLVQAEPKTTETTRTPEASRTPDEEDRHELFYDDEVERFQSSWQTIQTAFVDDPQRAVKEADELVAAVIQTLAATFAEHKSELESAWSQGEPATEDLRIALRRYRSFFKQLLRT
jgi:hypothetical protein